MTNITVHQFTEVPVYLEDVRSFQTDTLGEVLTIVSSNGSDDFEVADIKLIAFEEK